MCVYVEVLVLREMTMFVRAAARTSVGVAVIVLSCLTGTAGAQTAGDPNPGRLTFTGGLDVPSVYVFRGIVQELDSELTLFPYGDLGLALFSGDGGVKSVGVNVGVWNSLNTGSSGLDGLSDRLHYEEDFYATLSLGFGGGVTLGTTFTAYTSPNASFNTVKELSFKVAKTHMLSPYGVLAFELGDESSSTFGTADFGTAGAANKRGTYLELGVGPAFPLGGRVTLTVPVKVGLSLKDYYELAGVDNNFGFFDIGGLITIPLTGADSQFGSWNVHGGADVFVFGDTTRVYNNDNDKSKVVGLIGVGVTY
jgi:hypothetical protein